MGKSECLINNFSPSRNVDVKSLDCHGRGVYSAPRLLSCFCLCFSKTASLKIFENPRCRKKFCKIMAKQRLTANRLLYKYFSWIFVDIVSV